MTDAQNKLMAEIFEHASQIRDLCAKATEATIAGAEGDSRVELAEKPASASVPVPHVAVPTRIIPWGNQVSSDFIESVLWIEGQLGLRADCLMVCMKFESNLNSKAKNPQSTATGLIQFMAATAKRLGTTVEKLYEMTAIQQLSYVYRYFKEYADRGFSLSEWSLEDTYMAILWPAAIGKAMDYVMFVDDPKRLNDAYDVNKGLDFDKDGRITKQEATVKIRKLYAEGLLVANRTEV